MKTEFLKQFIKSARHLSGVTKKLLREKVEEVERATVIEEITECRKLQGFSSAYRIRIATHRALVILRVERDTLYFEYLVKRGDVYHKEYLQNLRRKE